MELLFKKAFLSYIQKKLKELTIEIDGKHLLNSAFSYNQMDEKKGKTNIS